MIGLAIGQVDPRGGPGGYVVRTLPIDTHRPRVVLSVPRGAFLLGVHQDGKAVVGTFAWPTVTLDPFVDVSLFLLREGDPLPGGPGGPDRLDYLGSVRPGRSRLHVFRDGSDPGDVPC